MHVLSGDATLWCKLTSRLALARSITKTFVFVLVRRCEANHGLIKLRPAPLSTVMLNRGELCIYCPAFEEAARGAPYAPLYRFQDWCGSALSLARSSGSTWRWSVVCRFAC